MVPASGNDFTLHPEHRDFLHRCALSDEVINGRPYYSLTPGSRMHLGATWGFSNEALRGSGIVIPRYSPDGSETFPQIRYDDPLEISGKEPRKYNCPTGSGGVIDVHPHFPAQVQDVNEPLVFAESIKGADALLSAGVLAVGFHGVWGWKHNSGPSMELRKIPVNGRAVGICFDVDVHGREDLQKALKEFGAVLRYGGAEIFVFVLPEIVGEKAGIDDYLAIQDSIKRGVEHGPSVG